MPLQGEFHTKYWEASDTTVAAVLVSGKGGYPLWQSSVIMGSGFGALAIWFEKAGDWCRWCWTLVSRSYRYDTERRQVVLTALDALDHPAYPVAQKAVRRTATTIGFNRPEAWKELSREIKSDPGRAENNYRHLEAMRLVRANLIESTVSNPDQNLIVELAYCGFARMGK